MVKCPAVLANSPSWSSGRLRLPDRLPSRLVAWRSPELWLLLSLTWLLAGCSQVSYYWQAASGHLNLLQEKQSIEVLLADPETDPELKKRLRLVQSVRTFAIDELKLPERAGYTGYVKLNRPYATAVVTAAQPLELKAYRWCYLLIGCQEYRGYFDEAEAQAYAQELAQTESLDVAVGYATAYSTLGWLNGPLIPDFFSDPILSTFLEQRTEVVIATLIHEMAHQVLYVQDDTSFNESFAVFVEQEGVRRFLETHPDYGSDVWERYQQAQQERARFRELIRNALTELQQRYEQATSDADKQQEKQRILAELKQAYAAERETFQVLSYDNWFAQDLNHAHLLGVARYHNRVAAFEAIFAESGGDWDRFYEQVRELGKLSATERATRLEEKHAS